EAVEIVADGGDGVAQVRGEGGDAALTRQVVAQHRHALDPWFFGHGQAAFPARRGGSIRCQRGKASFGTTNSNVWLFERSRRTLPIGGLAPVASSVVYSISRTHCRSIDACMAAFS